MPLYKKCRKPARKTLKQEVIELLNSCNYNNSVTFDMGKGKEYYEGCFDNLIMILEDPGTKCRRLKASPEEEKRFFVSVPDFGWKIYFGFSEN